MNCPICAQTLKIRYDISEFAVTCDTKVKRVMTEYPFRHTTEMSHFSQSIKWLDNVKLKDTLFVMDDMVFYARSDNTVIYELGTNRALLFLPREILPETVDLGKIKALILFS